ncbi:uncharacterized protein LAESUDRAFT_764515 [Laetiporus sulphureus 93-53]|uniref:Uncharacterized protein n=1 Tax=Laetiporus sulphureus 93-53 TaxID=1314785 RepID=A0A165B925_9APHY|nr:uncharacterized protein LAESUDRAFT_764515 [Laetiporus sulphureus 93-53]KZT00525.1 hypothetical protein LAESUDRAFT_764515 [Laetiporus sulphureus 93-53]
MSGADVWEDREDMLDRLWDRFRETGECLRSSEPPSVSHPWHVLTTQHLQELSSSCSALPYSYGTPTLSPAHTPSHLLAASVAAVMLLAGVPEAFTRLFCSRYRGTLASLLDNARGLREALGVMGASASEEVEVVKEEVVEMRGVGGDAGREDSAKVQGPGQTLDSDMSAAFPPSQLHGPHVVPATRFQDRPVIPPIAPHRPSLLTGMCTPPLSLHAHLLTILILHPVRVSSSARGYCPLLQVVSDPTIPWHSPARSTPS